MGKFIYGATAVSVDLDDRVLAHLRIVIMTKLRRNESFMFDIDVGGGNGRRTFWIHPSVPIQFHFFGGRQPRINREWVEEMIRIASSTAGLTIPAEPKESKAFDNPGPNPNDNDGDNDGDSLGTDVQP